MAGDGAVFLGEARLVEDRGTLALQSRRRAQQRAEGHDPGAAHTGQQDAVGLGARGAARLGQRGDRPVGGGAGLPRPPAPALDQDEARAEALEAGKILVAGGLVDRPLAPEFGLQRHHREAVRLHAAVAAAFAHVRVDDDPPVGVLQRAALAPPALLGRAHLVVDDRRDPLPVAQLALHPVERVAVIDGDAVRELPVEGVFLGLVGDHGDAAHPFRLELAGHALDRERPVHRLAAGHRDGVVVEHLVGDVDAAGDGSPDRENAGVEIGAVADVLEHVPGLGEGRLPDPARALAAHMGEGRCLAVHPLRHVVAADSRQCAAPLRHLGRAVVRAAGAEIGNPLDRRLLGRGALAPTSRAGGTGAPRRARPRRSGRAARPASARLRRGRARPRRAAVAGRSRRTCR